MWDNYGIIVVKCGVIGLAWELRVGSGGWKFRIMGAMIGVIMAWLRCA